MLRKCGDVVKGDFVRVTLNVFSVLGFTEGDSTDHGCLALVTIFEDSVSSEISSLLLI